MIKENAENLVFFSILNALNSKSPPAGISVLFDDFTYPVYKKHLFYKNKGYYRNDILHRYIHLKFT